MDIDDYDRLRIRVRGPLYAAGGYIEIPSVQKSIAICDEGHALLKKVCADLLEAQKSASALIAYVERMNGFNQ